MLERIQVIDSHTEGEPTRVVLSGGPDLGAGSIREQAEVLRSQHDGFRSAVVNEPRGSDAWVGALLRESSSSEAEAQVLFFNNVGLLGMCVHGMIGVGATLAHLGRLGQGQHRIETPVGEVTLELDVNGRIAIQNVPSYRYARGIEVATRSHGRVRGDVAYGGNWFFIIDDSGQEIAPRHLDALTDFSWDVRRSLERAGITGVDGALIDHIELCGPPTRADADSKNFVLCPGKAFDRSPCGTGTSAKMACLAADGKLREGESWRQESLIGSLFVGSMELLDSGILPTVRGRAYITAESTLLLDPQDPYRLGIELDDRS